MQPASQGIKAKQIAPEVNVISGCKSQMHTVNVLKCIQGPMQPEVLCLHFAVYSVSKKFEIPQPISPQQTIKNRLVIFWGLTLEVPENRASK